MNTNRSDIMLAALGASFVTAVGHGRPDLIPVLGLGLAAWLAVTAFLKL